MTPQTDHDLKSAIRFLENLYEEILCTNDLNDIKDPLVLKKFKITIELLEKILST